MIQSVCVVLCLIAPLLWNVKCHTSSIFNLHLSLLLFFFLKHSKKTSSIFLIKTKKNSEEVTSRQSPHVQYFLFCSGNQHLLSVPVLVCLPSPWSSTPVSLLTFPWFQQYLTWIVFIHLCVFITLQHFPMLVHMDFDLALLIGFLSNPWLVCCVQTGLLCMFTCFSSVSSLLYPEKRCHNHPKPKWHLHTACFVQKEQQMFTFVKPEPSNA